MVKIYYNLVKAGKRELEQVPPEFLKEVTAMLEADKESTQKK